MSYQVLARKWRPQIFTDVVGQEHVLTALVNSLSLGRLHHAYLLSGTRGVGKTTIARLLAKGLNCKTGITSAPCGKCKSCQEIEQGCFVDLIEIDAASSTKVEDTRELLNNVQYAPAWGHFKVYLIDEVHMLSRHSFNALLKTLEEPPMHVKFLLATTDPQKLPVTILSRCLQFHLKPLDIDQICNQLLHILRAEQITAELPALQLIARAADGSMRDALSITDQAILMGNGGVNLNAVRLMLGTLNAEQPLAIVEALVNADGNTMMAQLAQSASYGVDWEGLLIEILAFLHCIAIGQVLPDHFNNNDQIVQMRLRDLASRIPPTDLHLYYQILLIGRKELPYAPDRRIGVEMTLLRALALHPSPVKNYTLSKKNTQKNPLLYSNNTPFSDLTPVEPANIKPDQNKAMIFYKSNSTPSWLTKTTISNRSSVIGNLRSSIIPVNNTDTTSNLTINPLINEKESLHLRPVTTITTTLKAPVIDKILNTNKLRPLLLASTGEDTHNEFHLVNKPSKRISNPLVVDNANKNPMKTHNAGSPNHNDYHNYWSLISNSVDKYSLVVETHNTTISPQKLGKSASSSTTVQLVASLNCYSTTEHNNSNDSMLTDTTVQILKARTALYQYQRGQKIKNSNLVSMPDQKVLGSNTFERLALMDGYVQHNCSNGSELKIKKLAKSKIYHWCTTQQIDQVFELVTMNKVLRIALKHQKTPELLAQLMQEALTKDAWSAQLYRLSIPKLVQQMALNAWKEDLPPDQVCLHLRSTQRHVNSTITQNILAEALSIELGIPIRLTILEDDNLMVKTPLDWLQNIYEEKLLQARKVITTDVNIQMLQKFFNAELDDESIRPF